MRRLRHNYIALSDGFVETARQHLSDAVQSFLPKETDEIFLSANCVTQNDGRREPTSLILIDRLEEKTSMQHVSRLREILSRAVSPQSRSDLDTFRLQDYELIHINIILDMDGRNFFFSEESKSRVSFLSINVISKGGALGDFRMFKHYLESELRNDYQSYLFQSLIGTSNVVESTIEYSDPSELYILYLEQLRALIPDVDVVYWRFVSQGNFLQCDSCSDPTFDCDILDPAHSVVSAASGDTELKINSISEAKKAEGYSAGVYFACFDNGWRSALFLPVKVARESVGIIGFFVKYPGGVPEIYNQFADFVLQQTARFVVEKIRLMELMKLKGELKKLVPLLAIGNEVLQRNHDIRDQITVVRSNLISIRDTSGDAAFSQLSEKASTALVAIQRMTDVLSKQLQGFRSAKESRKSVPVSELIGAVQESMRVVSGIENVEMEVILHSDTRVRVQRFYIERVIENVIGNAIYFSKQTLGKNKVVVSVKSFDGISQIEVSDNGPGISQRPVSKVFDLGETTKPDGYGIGLAIASEIIEAHGGELQAKNKKEGGATFLLSLPQAPV